MTRRELMRMMAAAGFGSAFASRVVADGVLDGPKGVAVPERKLVPVTDRPHYPATIIDGKVMQPARPLPVMHETDVLVVGAGPAGFAAAVAAARAGAKTALVERYGYCGGLWTGGLVLLVEAILGKENGEQKQVVRGIGGELLDRLAKIDGAILNYGTGQGDPTTDPEATKYMMDEMIREAGVKVFFHCWVADVVMDGNAIRGVVFESKAGRQVILAKTIVDTTGDGDVFAAAGAEHEQRLHAIGLVHRLGNVDRADLAKLKEAGFRTLGSAEPMTSVKWINLRGPSTDGLDIGELSRLEMDHRRSIWNRVQKLRKAPGGDKLFLLQAAPQLGVRTTRLLAGTQKLTLVEANQSTPWPDTVAVGGADDGVNVAWPIPYGTLLPRKLDNLLTAGRSICVDEKLIEVMRLIGPCLATGHAAGAAAALAAQSSGRPRDVEIPRLQKLLRDQGAYLG